MKNALFQEELETLLGEKLHLKLTDNRSTLLRVRWDPLQTRVSLHRMFLNAPRNVMEALACYIRRDHKKMDPVIRRFMNTQLNDVDYTDRIDTATLNHEGAHFNLKEIYETINADYFDQELDLHYTWFGDGKTRSRSRISFGLYHAPLKLVKINRLLDRAVVPDTVVEYIMYHEMLHAVHPPYYDEKGVHRIHNAEFKQRERDFAHFQTASQWIKTHKNRLFFRGG